jgi:hypothetical protein
MNLDVKSFELKSACFSRFRGNWSKQTVFRGFVFAERIFVHIPAFDRWWPGYFSSSSRGCIEKYITDENGPSGLDKYAVLLKNKVQFFLITLICGKANNCNWQRLG